MRELYSWSWVEEQVAETIVVWNDCARRPWQGGPQFTPGEQRKREKAYDEGLRAVEREARKAPRTRAERLEAQRRTVAVFPRFAAIALGLEGETVKLLSDGFLPAGTQFARWARRLDPTLSMADTIQACRNAWTACGLQPLLGEAMGLTPSIVGYSLLYPYSDNYLDDEKVSKAEKLEFSARFRERLSGRRLEARNRREAAVWSMVQLIEEQYPRLNYPRVFECLLAIHRAQEQSIAQLNNCGDCDDSEVLKISCAKGGTSVLADACLSHGRLREEESRLAFEWGAMLQLGDDLQDVREDLRRGSATLFSRAAATGKPLDSLVTQLLNLSERVADRMDRLPNGPATLKELLRMSWRSVIVMALADAQEFFSPAFLVELERSSAFRFDFLRARKKRLAGRQGLYAVLFEAFLEAGEGDTDGMPLLADGMGSSVEVEADPVLELVAAGSS
ncbi:MAG: hypothetical protein ABSG62_10030 [Terracidiphilus sp.]|jgi:hypothetical protein